MTFQPGAMLNTQGFANRPENVEVPTYQQRAPASTDVNFPLGKIWLYVGNSVWYLLSQSSTGGVLSSNWIQLADADGPINSIVGTANQVSASTASGVTTLSTPATFIAPGSIAATTTLTATLGAITATNGNFVKGTAGNKDVYSSVATNATAGANSAGSVTLVGGTATIATTAVTANSLIRIYRQGIGATGAAALGILTIGTITAATSFVINSVQAADATALQASDVSVVFWEIVN